MIALIIFIIFNCVFGADYNWSVFWAVLIWLFTTD